MELRNKYKDLVFEKHGVKLGFMSAFIKAACHAAAAVPEVNARIEGDEIVYSDFVDISVAVATPKGLVTPVLRNCESLSMVEAEQAMAELGKKVSKSNILFKAEAPFFSNFLVATCSVFDVHFPPLFFAFFFFFFFFLLSFTFFL
jgi:pyruvate/2-oxoglutarate dehydrogenase complex dihydrolipoamide acyltransferase (E2) component